jgi:hypothetical protein
MVCNIRRASTLLSSAICLCTGIDIATKFFLLPAFADLIETMREHMLNLVGFACRWKRENDSSVVYIVG